MLPQRQPNSWSCLPTAFAIALDVPVENIIRYCGHDGSQLVYPDDSDKFRRRRSFHPQEMIDYCYNCKNKVALYIEAHPMATNGSGVFELPIKDDRMFEYLIKETGVLIGVVNKYQHAVAWDKSQCIDPNGTTYHFAHFNIRGFFVIKSM